MYAYLLYPVRCLLRWLTFIAVSSWSAYAQPNTSLSADVQIATQWATMSLDVIRGSPFNSPTYSSRALAYLGITMYESVVHSQPGCQSLAGQLSGLDSLPQPVAGQAYDWGLVLNTAQASMLYKLYPHAYRLVASRIDSLQRAVVATQLATTPPDVAKRSVQYGWALAAAIFQWSRTDGGHEGYNRSIDSDYPLPTGNGYWTPPTGGQSTALAPLHPAWGKNRPFVPANSRLPVPAQLPYASDSLSANYREFYAVYQKNKTLTPAEKAAAIWWADDPSHSYGPPGHSYNIATVVIRVVKPGLVKAAETYARVGMAVADAFINCWKCKFTYHRERPSTFINRYIQKDWRPFWPEPPFPAYSSGHSTQAAAAATVLAAVYGDHVSLTDSTHYGHPIEPISGQAYVPRHYDSFWAMAVECANSRLYGGIHTNHDNVVGLAEGRKIGQHVNALHWHR